MAFLHLRRKKVIQYDSFLRSCEHRTRTKLKREDGFIVEMGLDPCHEKVDVFRSSDFDCFLDFDAVGPEVLVPFNQARSTIITCVQIAIFGKSKKAYLSPAVIVSHVWAVQNSVMVPYNMDTSLKKSTAGKIKVSMNEFVEKKINFVLFTASHSFKSSPGLESFSCVVIDIDIAQSITFRKRHGLPHIPAPESCFRELGKLILLGAPGMGLHGTKCLAVPGAATR